MRGVFHLARLRGANKATDPERSPQAAFQRPFRLSLLSSSVGADRALWDNEGPSAFCCRRA